MNIYLLSQEDNIDYDTFDSVVVAAESEEKARLIHPDTLNEDPWEDNYPSWADSPDNVRVEFLGVAKEGTKEGIILASFNAG
jgi:hypothetical protein